VIFSPGRLGVARKRRMLNKTDFAQKLGVTVHTVVRWENGACPTDENLSAISRLLNFPSAFFFGEAIDWPDGRYTSFRSQTSMTASVRDAALAAGSLGFLISDWVDEKFELPPARIPDLHLYDDPEAAAITLRHEWQLGEKPIPNMIKLLESKGARVFSLAENTSRVNAYSLWRNGRPYVFLNTFKSSESSRFDAAHELAHLVLHQDGGVGGRTAEDQANRFASAFLMPKADVLAILPNANYVDQLVKTKARWNVSVMALNYRLHKIGITSDWRYRDLCIEASKRGYVSFEPLSADREKSSVWKQVLKALWKEGTTLEDISVQLLLPESELTTLLFGMLQPDSVPDEEIRKPLILVDSA
jgi:Zn-dependent peptidase ImmA (M78 family)/DNA-binding XRE family transcriptional regulator